MEQSVSLEAYRLSGIKVPAFCGIQVLSQHLPWGLGNTAKYLRTAVSSLEPLDHTVWLTWCFSILSANKNF